MVEKSEGSRRTIQQDAYFIVGYEDTPGFAIALSKAEVRAAICEVVYGGSVKSDAAEAKEELDSYMEWFEDDDHWSIDRSHWSVRFEIGGLEAWRFPASLVVSPESDRSAMTFKEWAEGYDKTYGFDSGDARRIAEVAWNAALATRSAERGVPS